KTCCHHSPLTTSPNFPSSSLTSAKSYRFRYFFRSRQCDPLYHSAQIGHSCVSCYSHLARSSAGSVNLGLVRVGVFRNEGEEGNGLAASASRSVDGRDPGHGGQHRPGRRWLRPGALCGRSNDEESLRQGVGPRNVSV